MRDTDNTPASPGEEETKDAGSIELGSSDRIYREDPAAPNAGRGDLGPDDLLAPLRDRDPESRYEARGEIGRGGMGAVLRIWDRDLDRPLAMKVILGQAERTGQTPPAETAKVARFLEEAQVTAKLDHPGIVPVHELGLDPRGRVFFTMRLVKGRDFSHILDEVGKSDEWTLPRALEILLKVCDAMAYAHAKGIIHRDLKPDNIRVGRFGEVYVMDWGLARVLGVDDKRDIRIRNFEDTTAVETERQKQREETPDTPLVTMDGDVVGTPAYMPPEQARGDVDLLDRRSDVYSLGTILYHLLTGQRPYVPADVKKITARTLLMRVLEGPPVAVRDLNPDAPPELVDICEKAMAREQDKRYAGTEELAEDLRRFLEKRPIAARSPSLAYVLRLAMARHKGLTTTAGLAAILVLATATVAFVLVNAARTDAIQNAQIAKRNQAHSEMAAIYSALVWALMMEEPVAGVAQPKQTTVAQLKQTTYEGTPVLQSQASETDPWGTAYEIENVKKGVWRVRSVGPDRTALTEDDIVFRDRFTEETVLSQLTVEAVETNFQEIADVIDEME